MSAQIDRPACASSTALQAPMRAPTHSVDRRAIVPADAAASRGLVVVVAERLDLDVGAVEIPSRDVLDLHLRVGAPNGGERGERSEREQAHATSYARAGDVFQRAVSIAHV